MTERTERNEAAAGAKPKRELGTQVMSPDAIPEGIKAAVVDKLGADARTAPAREGGGYKGKVIYANDLYMVQAVGQKQENAVVHRKSDVEFVGQKLGWREQNSMLNGVNVQVHYNGDKAKAYVWNKEREQAARTAKAQETHVPSKEERKAADLRASSDSVTRKLQDQIDKDSAAPKAPTKVAAKSLAKAPKTAEKAAAAPKAKASAPKARKAGKSQEKVTSGPER